LAHRWESSARPTPSAARRAIPHIDGLRSSLSCVHGFRGRTWSLREDERVIVLAYGTWLTFRLECDGAGVRRGNAGAALGFFAFQRCPRYPPTTLLPFVSPGHLLKLQQLGNYAANRDQEVVPSGSRRLFRRATLGRARRKDSRPMNGCASWRRIASSGSSCTTPATTPCFHVQAEGVGPKIVQERLAIHRSASRWISTAMSWRICSANPSIALTKRCSRPYRNGLPGRLVAKR
jgi:hypothetical protein